MKVLSQQPAGLSRSPAPLRMVTGVSTVASANRTGVRWTALARRREGWKQDSGPLVLQEQEGRGAGGQVRCVASLRGARAGVVDSEVGVHRAAPVRLARKRGYRGGSGGEAQTH